MHARVAFGAQCDQILFHVATRLTPEFEMVYLKVLHAAANLAPPSVARQYLAVQFAVAHRIEPESRALGADDLHEALRATSDKKPPAVDQAGTGSSGR